MSTKSIASTSSGSSARSVFGLFGKKQNNIPMQPTVTVSFNSSNNSTLSELPNAAKAGPRSDMERQRDMLSDFFGGNNQRLNDTSSLPSYVSHNNVEAPPQYGEGYAERPTLARYMFKYGFFLPLLWVVGIFTLCVPLRPVPGWENNKSEEEQERILDDMRRVELKWAKRCLYALSTFLVIVALIIIIVWLALRHH